jgi:hypothetical protein
MQNTNIAEALPELAVDTNDINLSLEELRNKYSATIMAQLKKTNFTISDYTNYNVLIYEDIDKNRKIYFGLCEDCSTLNILREQEACATGFTCCTKQVCIDDCLVYCSAGHLNTYYNCRDDLTFECEVCYETITPKCKWHGISNAEYERRYG